jgi:two-component system NtrC family sensor kinase
VEHWERIPRLLDGQGKKDWDQNLLFNYRLKRKVSHMKFFVFVISLSILTSGLFAQTNPPYNEDSLRAILDKTPRDTVRVNILQKLAGSYFFKQPDSCLLYSEQSLEISRELNYTRGIQNSLFRAAEAHRHRGNIIDAIKLQFELLGISQKIGDKHFEANALGWIGVNYFDLHDYRSALGYLKKAVSMRQRIKPPQPTESLFNIYIGRIYSVFNNPDSALYFLRASDKAYAARTQGLKILRAIGFGDAYLRMNKMDSADFYHKVALTYVLANPEHIPMHLSMLAAKLSEVYSSQHRLDSSFYYAMYAFRVAKKKNLNLRILESSRLLSQLYRDKGKLDSAWYYQDIASAMYDSIYGGDNLSNLQLLVLQEQRRNQEIQQAEEQYKNTIKLIGSVSITAIILIASILLFRSNRIKQKTNLVLQQTLNELKATQSQLIQSEKMASLGELTAGIAHEIQNPLNFVNNFSEVNAELIDDLKKEMASGNRQSADEIADNIKENQEKINHHGKRADGIVKSMLQHSRVICGEKELTEINALCDEYIRLTYHGYRVKDKSFNAAFKVNLDASIPKVNVIPQDIGRVILNLVNNAFHAVGERSAFAKATADEGYEPIVTISTKRVNARIEIRVQDNGSGIADSIKEKIFQPFFTTKPTGQGTGLGLSLSYDIIKAHGGMLEVNSEEGVGSEFIIQLPT